MKQSVSVAPDTPCFPNPTHCSLTSRRAPRDRVHHDALFSIRSFVDPEDGVTADLEHRGLIGYPQLGTFPSALLTPPAGRDSVGSDPHEMIQRSSPSTRPSGARARRARPAFDRPRQGSRRRLAAT